MLRTVCYRTLRAQRCCQPTAVLLAQSGRLLKQYKPREIHLSCQSLREKESNSAQQHGTEAADYPAPSAESHTPTKKQDMIEPTEHESKIIASFLKQLKRPSPVRDQLISDVESPAMREIRLQQEILYRVRAKQSSSLLWRLLTPITSRKNELLLTSSAFYVSAREQAEKQSWRGLGLPDNLGNWFNIVMLHMWMMLFRLRNMEHPRSAQNLSQYLIDYFFDDVEEGIIKHSETANPIIVSKGKKSFVHSYLGAMMACDDAVLKSDAALADVLFNNIFGLNKDTVSAVKLEKLVAYIRREMKNLDQTTDEALYLAKHRWGEPPTF